jgi:hypothetical protein
MKIDFTLTPSDQRTIKSTQVSHPAWRLSRMRADTSYQAGDFLVKRLLAPHHRMHNPDGKYETISTLNNTLKRYICLHIDEQGIAYLRGLNTDGKIGMHLIVVDNQEWDKYEVDPLYADHIILGNDPSTYNPYYNLDDKKKAIEKIHRANKRLALDTSTPEKVQAIFENMTPGTPFWMDDTLNNLQERRYVFVSLERVNGSLRIKTIGGQTAVNYIVDYYIFTTEPLSYEGI